MRPNNDCTKGYDLEKIFFSILCSNVLMVLLVDFHSDTRFPYFLAIGKAEIFSLFYSYETFLKRRGQM